MEGSQGTLENPGKIGFFWFSRIFRGFLGTIHISLDQSLARVFHNGFSKKSSGKSQENEGNFKENIENWFFVEFLGFSWDFQEGFQGNPIFEVPGWILIHGTWKNLEKTRKILENLNFVKYSRFFRGLWFFSRFPESESNQEAPKWGFRGNSSENS